MTAALKTSIRPRDVARSSPGLPFPSRRKVLLDIAVTRDRFGESATFRCMTSRWKARTSRPPSLPAPTRRKSIGQADGGAVEKIPDLRILVRVRRCCLDAAPGKVRL